MAVAVAVIGNLTGNRKAHERTQALDVANFNYLLNPPKRLADSSYIHGLPVVERE